MLNKNELLRNLNIYLWNYIFTTEKNADVELVISKCSVNLTLNFNYIQTCPSWLIDLLLLWRRKSKEGTLCNRGTVTCNILVKDCLLHTADCTFMTQSAHWSSWSTEELANILFLLFCISRRKVEMQMSGVIKNKNVVCATKMSALYRLFKIKFSDFHSPSNNFSRVPALTYSHVYQIFHMLFLITFLASTPFLPYLTDLF